MSDTRAAAAIEAVSPAIERLLRAAFEQLDAVTPDVAARRQLYADLIARAVGRADERLPDSKAVRDAVAELFGLFHPHPADSNALGQRERSTT